MTGLPKAPRFNPLPPAPINRIVACTVSPGGAGGELAADNASCPFAAIASDGGRLEFVIPASLTGGASLTVHADGYVAQTVRCVLDAELLEAPLDLQPDAPPIVGLPRLVTRGQCFALETGEAWTAIQCSDFHLFGRFLNGEDISAVLSQRSALGFNLLRVWTRYDLTQYGIGRCVLADHPDLYDRVPEFLDLCASFGLYVELTAYTGREDYDPQHWARLGDAALWAHTLPLCEFVNENDQGGNHIDASQFQPIAGVLCSHGSNGSEARPVEPFWQYATFHTNGASEWWRKNGHNAMEIWGGPTLTNEATRAADQDSSPAHFEDAAAGAALLCAGSCFHAVHGKNSTLFEGIELDCAAAHVRGAQSVHVSCQPGEYRHRSDLEGPGDLRVYQRGSDAACLVRIRA